MTAPRLASCPTCNTALTDGDRFCKQCGTEVSGITPSLSGAAASARTPAPTPDTAAGSPWETVLARLRDVTLGEFDIGRELGRGGMAAVFLAHDLALNRKVAIKVMAPGLMLGEGMVQRFRQEAITIANLSHAHIVSIHAVRQLEDLHFFVMQFVEGQSLETVLRTHGALPVPVVRAILFQVGSALAYAHRRGVIHRDIKPGNILMSGDGDAMVTDFGIAKVAEGPTQTQTGMVVGTPTYMSPEQCYAAELDGASDQYSLGVVAYQMLTGRVPFSGSAFAIMKGHTTEPVPPIRSLVPDVPEEVDAAILRMLAKTPQERFATFGDALQAMGAHALGQDAPLRQELITLAAVEERRAALGSLLHTPGTPAPRTRPPVTVSIAAPSAALHPGDRHTLQATVSGAGADDAVSWHSEDPARATVDEATGVVTAVTPGSVRVHAACAGSSASVELTVLPAVVATLSIAGVPALVRTGDRFTLRAIARDAHGAVLERPVAWRSSAPACASVSGSGEVHTLEAGAVELVASAEAVESSVQLTVHAPPAAFMAGATSDDPQVAPPSATSVLSSFAEEPEAAQDPAPPPLQPPSPAGSEEPLPLGLQDAWADTSHDTSHHLSGNTARETSAKTSRERSPNTSADAADAESGGRPRWMIAAALLPVLAIAGWLALRGSGDTAPDGAALDGGAADGVAGAVATAPGATSPGSAQPLPTPAGTDGSQGADTPPLPGDEPERTSLNAGASTEPGGSSSGTRTPVVERPGSQAAGAGASAGAGTAATPQAVNRETAAASESASAAARPSPVTTGDAGDPAAGSVGVTRPPVAPAAGRGASDPAAGASPPPSAVSQAQLAREARATVEAFAAAISSRDMARVRSVYPGITASYAAELAELFDYSREVRVSVNGVTPTGGSYDSAEGGRSQLTASVTFRIVPTRGSAPPPSNDSWPVTLQRTASGWRLLQVGTP